MIRKLIRIGNSHGVTLDKRMLRDTGLESVTYLAVELDKKNQRIIIRKRRENEW